MRFLIPSALITTASATGILLPLYVYPSATYNDGAANWTPVLTAASSNPFLRWLTVIDPQNGPGGTYLPGNNDINYITGVSKLNAHANIKTIGYVRTDYAKSPLDEVKHNITTWKNWDTYTGANISVQGIFFDESAQDAAYMKEVVGFAKSTFGRAITTVCNFGAAVDAAYYGVCDVVVAFESCLNCALGPQYKSGMTIDANVPVDKRGQGAVIVHHFEGTAFDGSVADGGLVRKYLGTVKEKGLGWVYFCSKDYNDIGSGPATVGEVARGLA
ncbi:cell surface spherulin 4-like protein [Pochonia chlamydosporia 170]|uniref:Cell surface spherulin 4-like protein n=1 Tax=Pochonia chlamydosporia 170 TaxID=1380566 RepID=A0A179FXI5_METCM|nr:cell surface spherulin 4-like protein [Pochonia chlamydosporia 170]OAQ70396.1 cell surface spherulin 4-like protein [Pochonia chlamydosporia 170]